MEALQRCQLSASTATLAESDNKGILSPLEDCRMKGRRVSVSSCHQTKVTAHLYLMNSSIGYVNVFCQLLCLAPK